jgi:putative redox protein
MELTHEASGTTLVTDAPRDNNGDASSFSPTDLTASSLLACMMTIIAIKAEQKGISLEGMNGSVEKNMAVEPRRISELRVTLEFPSHLSAGDRRLFEAVAKSCPVFQSLHPDVKVDCRFR